MRILLALFVLTSLAHADRGTRVALIDARKLYSEAGIIPWAEAKAKLDAEAKVAVESWDDKTVKPPPAPSGSESLDRARKMVRESQERTRRQKHENEVLSPIRDAVWQQIEPFAKARGIDLVIDISTLDHAIWYVGPTLDITDAFIKDYNARWKRSAKPKP